MTTKKTDNGVSQTAEPRGIHPRTIAIILAFIFGILIWNYLATRSERSHGEGDVTFFNRFKKNEPIDGLHHYLLSLENGDRERLFETVYPGDSGSDQTRVLVDFALEINTVIAGFRDIYGLDLTTVIDLELSPLHRSDDVKDAVFSLDRDRIGGAPI